MKEEIENRVVILLDKLIAGIDKTGEFALEAGSEIYIEILHYKLATSIIAFIAFLFVQILVIYIIRLAGKDYSTYHGEYFLGRYYEDRSGYIVLFAISSIFFLITTVISITDITKVIVAPKLVLIDVLQELLK